MKSNLELNYKINPSHDCIKFVKSDNQESFTKHLYDDEIISANLCPSLISILFNTNNIQSSVNSIEKFVQKAKDPSNIQFCIKIDNEENFVEEFLKSVKHFKCHFIVLSSPKGRGYIDLWQWINFLYAVSSRKSYFFINISDEMYVQEKNWDIKLKKYIDLEKDGIFRLRTSVYKNRNYNNLFECGYAPDTTAIYSKKYLKIQGNFSPCFGPDNGQQFVAYYLATLNYPRHFQFSRDYVINTISFAGQGTNKGLKGSKQKERLVINYLLWQNMFKHKHQLEYFCRARKIQIEILRSQFQDIDIFHNKFKRRFEIRLKSENDQNLKLFLSYNISKIKIFLHNISKINFFLFHTGFSRPFHEGILFHFYVILFKKLPKQKYLKESPKTNYLTYVNLYVEKTSLISKKFNNILSVNKKIFFLEYIFFLIGLFFFTLYALLLIHQFRINISLLNKRFKIFTRLYFQHKKSYIFSNNKLDQSKTVVVRSDD